jgi:inorganic triphosphatase YgiF
MLDSMELEGKFACTSDDLERAAHLEQIGNFRLVKRGARVQTDVYFDTTTLALRAASSSLRLRDVGGKTKATFKGPREAVTSADDETHLVQRLEVEVPVTPPLTDHREFVERLDVEPVVLARALVTNGQDLQPIARLVTHRRTFHFKSGNGEEVELSLDSVDALDLRHDRASRLIEIEIELIAGTGATLVAAAAALHDAIPTLKPSGESKLARALGESRPPPRQKPKP